MNSEIELSVVTPVRDRWDELGACMDCLVSQRTPPPFEFIVIDDGSATPAPNFILSCKTPFRVRYFRQTHLGIAAARNRGVHYATGNTILFIDSDCVPSEDCLAHLAEVLVSYPNDVAFQLFLEGSRRNMVSRIEGIRLLATQQSRTDSNNTIKYINTSAFAIRRSYVAKEKELFDVNMVRSEDTALLAHLHKKAIRPRFVSSARVCHQPTATLSGYMLKHFWIGYHSHPVRCASNDENNVYMTNESRKEMLRLLWRNADTEWKNKIAFLLIFPAYLIERLGRMTAPLIGMMPGKSDILGIDVDHIRESALQCRIVSAAERRNTLKVTYVTAWTLVQMHDDASFRSLLRSFDIVYADGIGVIYTAWLLRLTRILKVTANDFFFTFLHELEYRRISVAFIGADSETSESFIRNVASIFPDLIVKAYSSGYFTEDQKQALVRELQEAKPQIVVIGMGQPLQEEFVNSVCTSLEGTVFWCVGGLFDYHMKPCPAPRFIMRRIGLEWLWRLCSRPRRNWRRYVIGIPMLFLYIIRSMIVRMLYVNKTEA